LDGALTMSKSLIYRREIDGLRAVAVVPVILFHAGFGVFSGGFVGVDIFFVISGYLITTILINEIEQGTFSIASFYERRARRILPALFVVMLSCLPFAYMWMWPSQLKDFAGSIFAVTISLSNLFFLSKVSYFAPSAELQPLLHTWSLAIEEQYYFIFPIFLIVANRLKLNTVSLVVFALVIISFVFSEWAWRENAERSFFFTISRFWEIGVGSLCAFWIIIKAPRSNNILSIAGLTMIFFSIFAYDSNTPFPSAYALVPVVGTAMVILFALQGTWAAQMLSMRAFVSIGLISYSAYLWHQPLFAFARLRTLTEPNKLLMACLAIAALLLAWITWRFIEQPFRKSKNSIIRTRSGVFFAGGAVGALFIIIGLAGHIGAGFEWRGSDQVNLANLEERIIINHGLSQDCEGTFNSSRNCYTSISPNVLLWGDSYAMHLAQGILASDKETLMQQHTMSSCAPILGVAQIGGDTTTEWADRCISFNGKVLDWLQAAENIELVILSSPFRGVLGGSILLDGGEILRRDNFNFIKHALRETVREIRLTGAHVLIVSPTPASGWDVGQCLTRSVYFEADEASCDFELDTDTEPFSLLRSVSDDVAIYWLHDNFCDGGRCNVLQDGIFIYRDEGHLSKEGSAYLGESHDWMANFMRMAY
jgi:peptidoglycan/LPS O-acetylase OafA/YrhL